jgi:hypothetical protein
VRRRVVSLLSAALLLTGVACSCGGPRRVPVTDDRAYAVDSGELTLDEGLKRAGIRIPGCLAEDLRYALVNDGFNYYYWVYLSLRTSEECMNEFLDDNNIRNSLTGAARVEGAEYEKPLRARPLWMDRSEVREMGWSVGPEQSFQDYGARTGTDYTIDMVIQHVPGTDEVQGYLYAFKSG